MARNIEIKARVPDLGAIRHYVGAHFEVFEDRQRGEYLAPLGDMRDPEMGTFRRRHLVGRDDDIASRSRRRRVDAFRLGVDVSFAS